MMRSRSDPRTLSGHVTPILPHMSGFSFTARVPVFDANVGVGHLDDDCAPFSDAAGLAEEMARHGVDRSGIYHVRGETRAAREGNELLTRWVDGEEEAFNLQFVAGPDEECLRQLQERHASSPVASVRLHSTSRLGLPFLGGLYGDLLAWLESEGIPLWLSLSDTDTAEAMATLARFPDLVTVLVGVHYVHYPFVRPFLRSVPTAVMELSRYEIMGQVERLLEEFGCERFVYGSYYPRYSMGEILFYLHHIELSPTELAMICAGNLERILTRRSGG